MMADITVVTVGMMAGNRVIAGWLVAAVRLLTSSLKGTGDIDALFCGGNSAAAIPEINKLILLYLKTRCSKYYTLYIIAL